MAEEKMNFYRSFYDAGKALRPRDRAALYDAMLAYFFEGAEPAGLSPVACAVFGVARGRIDKSRTNAANVRSRYVCAPKAAGAVRDGESVAYETPYENAGRSESVAYEKRDSYRPEGEGDRGKTPSEGEGVFRPPSAGARRGDADPLGEPPRAGGRAYARPSPAEVSGYLAASGAHPVDAERFVNWHDAHGWPPRGWQGAALNWARTERERGSRKPDAKGAGAYADLDGYED